MGASSEREKIEKKMLELKYKRVEIQEEKEERIKQLRELTGGEINRKPIPDYIDDGQDNIQNNDNKNNKQANKESIKQDNKKIKNKKAKSAKVEAKKKKSKKEKNKKEKTSSNTYEKKLKKNSAKKKHYEETKQ